MRCRAADATGAIRGGHPLKHASIPVPAGFSIDPAEPGDLEHLQQIEAEASQQFPETHIPAALRGGCTPLGDLRAGQRAGLLWVVRKTATGKPVGFALLERSGPHLHLLEMDVLPEHGGLGLGAALLGSVVEFGYAQDCEDITLTTFRHLPWNAPFYARFDFVPLERAQLDRRLRAIFDSEISAGLDPTQRVAMRRVLD